MTSTHDLDLRIGSFRYDTTRALFDGSVRIDGVRSTTVSTGSTLPDVFGLLLGDRVDAGELGVTFLLRALEAGAPYVAVPVFPNRVFRHSCVFVNAESGINGPDDLVDRTIGEFGIYGQDSGVWAKGVLMDDYGFRPEQNRWVVGGLEHPSGPFDFTTHPHPEDLDITTAPEGETLNRLLETGSIDALFTANVPQAFLEGSPNVRRLFPDYEARERSWFRRTGLFPIMHTVVVRRDLLEAHPGLGRAVYDGFLEAKEQAAQTYREMRRLYQVSTMLPWANALFDENHALMGEDWWPYGIAANRAALETELRYHHEQGLTERLWSIEEVFAPGLLDT